MSDYYNQMLQGMEGFDALIRGELEHGRNPFDSFNANAPNGYNMHTEPNFGFLQLNPASGPVSGDWKFHISTDVQDVPRAWDIVVDELMRDGANHTAKVVKPDTAQRFSNPDSIQAGKMITVYPNDTHSPQHYEQLMARIEQRLDAAGIKPGPATNADRAIPGSKYASYRRETDPNGRYMSSSSFEDLPKEQRWNPHNSPDPYGNVDFSNLNRTPANQPVNADSNPRANNNLSTPEAKFLKGDWQEALTENGQSIIRLPVGNMPAHELENLESVMKAQGLDPIRHTSSTLGPTIRLAGDDVGSFKALQGDLNGRTMDVIGRSDWFDVTDRSGAGAKYINVDSLSDGQLNALQKSLGAQDIDFELKQSSLNGGMNVIAVTGDDANALTDITSKFTVGNVDLKVNAADIAEETAEAAGGFWSNLGKRSGFIGGAVIGVGVGGATLVGGGSAAQAAEATFEIAVPYGETGLDLASGDIAAAAKSATVETVSNVASVGGAAAGAWGGLAVGAAVGSVVPVVGTAVGGAVGAVVGGVAGAIATGVTAGYVTEVAIDSYEVIADTTMTAVGAVNSTISSAYDYATTTSPKQAFKDVAEVGVQAAQMVQEAHQSFQTAVTDTVSSAWSNITGFFNSEVSDTEFANNLDLEQLRQDLRNTSLEGLSPETQSLAQLSSDPELFNQQFNEMLEQGSLKHVLSDMPQVEAQTLEYNLANADKGQSSDLLHRTGTAQPAAMNI